MTALASAGAGFLLAVLWFDLMFDVQARGSSGRVLSEEVLGSIAGYYRRVTTTSQPMSLLIVVVMLLTLAAIVAQIAGDDVSGWAAWTSLALAVVPIGLAGGRTVPSAVRLGARQDSIEHQTVLARSILREHVVCFAAIGALLVVQLAWA